MCALIVGGACSSAIGVAPTTDVAWRARLLRIEDTRRDESGLIDTLLAGDDERARAAAAITVGRIGDRSHLVALRELTTDRDTAVAASAFFALGLLKDTLAADRAVLALHGPTAAAQEAAWLLGELGDRERAAITSALGDPLIAAPTRGALLLAAARLRPVPAAAVTPWVSSADSAVAWRAAYALARGRTAAGVRTLLAASRTASEPQREQVARGLARSLAGDSLGQQALSVLTDFAGDTSARVRINAVRALASYGAPSRTIVVAALRDSDAGVRLAAAQSLDQLADSSHAFWFSALEADSAFVFQRAVADAAARRGVFVAEGLGWPSSTEWQRRAAAASLDARGNALDAVGRVDHWMHDSDARVRAQAAGDLATLADSGNARESARTRLRAALVDPDFGVRAAALGGLTGAATAADLSTALDAYRLARADADADARLAFWQLADSALKHAGASLPADVDRRLAALPRPTDPLERIAAARIPRFAAWRDSTGTPRPLAWYEARAREMMAPQPVARIETERGAIELVLFSAEAPLTVYNFTSLARRGYFDGLAFHRVVPNFVVQGGDPRGDGNGGPGYSIRDELNRHRYLRGTLGMALSGPNTGGSQFFVTHSPQPHLDGGYTVFGQLLTGGDVLDRIVQGDRIVRIVIR